MTSSNLSVEELWISTKGMKTCFEAEIMQFSCFVVPAICGIWLKQLHSSQCGSTKTKPSPFIFKMLRRSRKRWSCSIPRCCFRSTRCRWPFPPGWATEQQSSSLPCSSLPLKELRDGWTRAGLPRHTHTQTHYRAKINEQESTYKIGVCVCVCMCVRWIFCPVLGNQLK